MRVFVVLQEIDDAAPNNLMSGHSEEAMNEKFAKLYPGPMANLPALRFIEPLNPNNEKFKYPSEPYVFVSDVVVQSEDFIDVTQAMSIPIRPAQWESLAELRDQIAPDEKIGWFVVHNGDLEIAEQERVMKEENGIEVDDDPAERIKVFNFFPYTVLPPEVCTGRGCHPIKILPRSERADRRAYRRTSTS